MDDSRFSENELQSVAIIGMSIRFPGAETIAQYWQNLADGIESIIDFETADLINLGVPENLLAQDSYVKRGGCLDNVIGFDAQLFGIAPMEAELMDPQHRLLLECAYESIEYAGYNPFGFEVPVGVFTGVSISEYLIANLVSRSDLMEKFNGLQLLVGNDKSYASTRISHKLGLRGPSLAVDSACSTSLVCIHQACRSLLSYECDYAIAGAAKVSVPHGVGYLFQEGGILSPDGHCRPFDISAGGTLHSSGVGVVFLKRLVDAIEDRDIIHAVIRGSAINNDGAHKIGYTAPSVTGQAEVIAEAFAVANIHAEDISYIETHGTGTSMGDPIEISALQQVFSDVEADVGRCAIGSVKGNIGHLDVAAGISGLIKTVLALENKTIPRTVNYRESNAQIDFSKLPFYVSETTRSWPCENGKRLAGVSSFGIGGTNAHVVLEEAGERAPLKNQPGQDFYLFSVSAQSKSGLHDYQTKYKSFLHHTTERLVDIAYTSNIGRPHLPFRKAYVVADKNHLASLVDSTPAPVMPLSKPAKIAYLFTGQGSQYAEMAKILYSQSSVFRKYFCEVANCINAYLNYPIESVIWGIDGNVDETCYTQPALFVVELALAKTWDCFGVKADYLIGHSIGEVVAACYAGVFSLEDAAKLIVARAKAMNATAEGAMLAVAMSREELGRLLEQQQSSLEIAADNSTTNVVLSGLPEDIANIQKILQEKDIKSTRLNVKHAFHSRLMDSALDGFRKDIGGIKYKQPNCKIVSNITAEIADEVMLDSEYWVQHVRKAVEFKQGIEFLANEGVNVYLEIGPSPTLLRFAQNTLPITDALWLKSLQRDKHDWEILLNSLARYYEGGGTVNWESIHESSLTQRVALPTYPFQREEYWSLQGYCRQRLKSGEFFSRENNKNQHDATNYHMMEVAHSIQLETTSDSLSFEYHSTNKIKDQAQQLWRDVLGVESIASSDDFFELGGHSLLLLQLNQRITSVFGVAVPPVKLIENSQFGQFCDLLTDIVNQGETVDEYEQVTIDFENRHDAFPLTPLQQSFLLGRESDFGLGGVSTHLYFESHPKLFNYSLFCESFNALINRHDMLRAVIINNEQQRILENVPYYEVHYYRPTSDDELNRHLEQLRNDMSHQVMPADQWPLFDVRVTEKLDGDVILHFSIDLLMLDVHSNQIIFRDLDALYARKAAQLPVLDMCYRDYVLAEHRYHSGPRYEKAKAYWQERIPHMQLAPDLSLVKNPAEIQQPKFIRRLEELDVATSAGLRIKAKEIGITPSVLLIAAYGMVLSRWSQRSAFTLNLTMFSRLPLNACVNDVVGDFTTLTLLSLDYTTFENFKILARNIQKQLWSDLEYSSFNGVEVIRELTRHYGGDHQITMPVVFTSALPLDDGTTEFDIENSLMDGMDESFSISQTPQVWIDHVAAERDGCIILSWDSIDELFADGMLDAMFGEYTKLVRQLSSSTDIWQQSRIDLLPAIQRIRRDEANNTSHPLPGETLIHHYLNRVEQQPDALAIIQSDLRITYRNTHQHILHWANWLQENDIQRGELVAIFMEKGWQQPIAAIAIQLAGAAYLPLDASLPDDRCKSILDFARVRLILTQDKCKARLDSISASSANNYCVGTIDNSNPISALEFKINPPKLSDLAYVLFTSGSTGVPKGVMIDHLGAANTMLDIIARFDISPRDRALAVSSMSFDLSVFDMFGVLAAGACMVIPEPENVRDPGALHTLMTQHAVTVLNTVPAMVQALVDYHEVNASQFNPGLRLIMMGGDFIPVELPQRIRAVSHDVDLHSMGGPTETAIYSVSYPIETVGECWSSIPYGKPLRNRKCWVLDDEYNDRPDGVPGEIIIGGDGCIALGYWGNDQLTEEKFIIHPETGVKMFKTGDLGRYLADGNIEILGRRDFQVKINGFRVELAEIENILQRQDEIKQVVVAAKNLDGKLHSLVAYVVLHTAPDDEKSFIRKIKNQCAAALPDYMVPHYVMIIECLPLSANGKVDRRALPMPDLHQRQRGYEAPVTPLEEKLVAIWQELLGSDQLGTRDSFFDLGGHSLIAAQMVTRIRNSIHAGMTIKLLFSNPYVADLAAAISSLPQQQDLLPAMEILLPDQPPLLSFAQQRLWFIDQLDSSAQGYGTAYNMPILWRIDGQLDMQAFRLAVQNLLDHHQIFRTSIENLDGYPLARLYENIPLPWEYIDVRAEADIDQQVDILIREELNNSFQLDSPPLIRLTLIQSGAHTFTCVINMHHIVTDAWSVGLISKEIFDAYRNIIKGGNTDFERVPDSVSMQYKDYAGWQRNIWDQGLMQKHEEYWLEVFSNVPEPLQLPTDYPVEKNKNYRGNARLFQLTTQKTDALKIFAQANGLTPFMVLLGAYGLLLHRYTGQRDIVIGTDTANRTPAETENMIGYFINQIGLNLHVDEEKSVDQYFADIKECVVNGYEHDVMPFDRLVEKLNIDRNLNSSPLFQVKLNYHSVEDVHLDVPGLAISPYVLAPETVQYDMVLTFKLCGDSLLGTLQCRSQIFTEATQLKFIEQYTRLLDALIDASGLPLKNIPHQHQAALDKLVQQGQASEHYPQVLSLIDRFENCVARYPNKVAVIDHTHISYGELNRRANILANELVNQGVFPGNHVAVYLERGALQVVAILAILKAGAAYVPLDFRTPAERVQLILEDAKPCLLIHDQQAWQASPLETETHLFNLDTLDFTGNSPCTFSNRSHPNLPAYIIYTSGTTGKPNGVVVSHAHVGRLLDSCQVHYQFNEQDVWTFFHSYVFDFSVWEIWGALCYGGSLVCVSYWTSRTPQAFYQLMREARVTVLNQTPSAFGQLANEILNNREDHKNLLSLRYVIFGGEALDSASLVEWFNCFGDQHPRLINMYGITETTVHVSIRQLKQSDTGVAASVIGRAINDLDMYILDSHMRPQIPGCSGQMFVGGDGLSYGYLNRPSLNAQRFIPNPFSKKPGARLYCTGDLAKWNSDCSDIRYLGRMDLQVQIRGHRVELGEIEHALLSHDSVNECVVLDKRDSLGQTTLNAYWVRKHSASLDGDALRQWLQEKVPGYMVPSHFIQLPSLPLTINGKVDRKLLLDIEPGAQLGERYDAPQSEIEIAVIAIAEQLLNIERIGTNHNFFALGGHSMLATQLLSRIRDHLDVDATLKDIFEASDFQQLALRVEYYQKQRILEQLLDHPTGLNSTADADNQKAANHDTVEFIL